MGVKLEIGHWGTREVLGIEKRDRIRIKPGQREKKRRIKV
jgi:hypothetical protein